MAEEQTGDGCGGCGGGEGAFAVWVRSDEGAAEVRLCGRCFGMLEAVVGYGPKDGRSAAALVAGYVRPR